MLQPWILIFFCLLYIGILFAIAHFGDKQDNQHYLTAYRPIIYSLSLAVYCTSWTYYGAVGNASTRGWEFLAIYLGPILMVFFGHHFLKRMARICIENNITTIADFIASRYGKSQKLAVLVTLIALTGTLPYIALQLKAVSTSYEVIASNSTAALEFDFALPFLNDTGMVVAIIMAVFSILFGTRYVNASEHHQGIILAIAFESVVKLFALICVCLFAVYGVFDGPRDILAKATQSQEINDLLLSPGINKDFLQTAFLSNCLLSAAAIFCLPRQFHVAFVEVEDTEQIRTSRWVFPLYLIVTSIIVIPIAASGLYLFDGKQVNPDMFVLTIPMFAQNDLMTLLVFIGGFSAATSMVIIAVITLSTMICNDIVMPILFKVSAFKLKDRKDITTILLTIRRLAIVTILVFSYFYYRYISAYTALSSIGLIAFVAAIQFAPAIIGGVYWKNATRRGATLGLIAGFLIWFYTLFLPALANTGWFSSAFIEQGLWGIEYLKPYALFGFDQYNPISHALIMSLTANIACYIYFSLSRKTDLIERIQAAKFTQTSNQKSSMDGLPWWSSVAVGELRILAEKFIGEEPTRIAFSKYTQQADKEFIASEKADKQMIEFTESLLSGAIGAASARLMIGSVIRDKDLPIEDVFSIVDEASQAVHFNQELLNNTIEHIDQGICVTDENQQIIAWNSRFLEIYNYPKDLIKVGRPIVEVILHNEKSSQINPGQMRVEIEQRLSDMQQGNPHSYLRYRKDGSVIHIQGKPMPNVGYVTSLTDVTELKRAEKELLKTNENLEKIVAGRTLELSKVNQELEQAITSKNRFLTAVNHDVMQPLNAARLFTSALAQQTDNENGLTGKINNSIRSAEQIIHTLLDVSKLDSGAIKTQITTFNMNKVLETLHEEFSVIAAQRNINLKLMFTSLSTSSDEHLVRRILQNFISNALRHTHPGGRVTIGCRRKFSGHKNMLFTVEVHDTGVGIHEHDLDIIFNEFKRLDNQIDDNQKGVGLGLAICKRISHLLGLNIFVKSRLNKGSIFSLELPYSETKIIEPPNKPAKDKPAYSYEKLSSAKVLCIDNDSNVVEAMQTLLDTWGCQHLCVPSHDQAVNQMNRLNFVPDILLIDYHLDNENGIEVINKLFEILNSNTAAVLISADISAKLKKQAKQLNLNYLSKPVNPAVLRKLISHAIKKKSVSTQ